MRTVNVTEADFAILCICDSPPRNWYPHYALVKDWKGDKTRRKQMPEEEVGSQVNENQVVVEVLVLDQRGAQTVGKIGGRESD